MKTMVRVMSGLLVEWVGPGRSDRLEVEPKVTDPGQQAVQLRLIDDVADQLGHAAASFERHAVEGSGQALAQTAANRDAYAERGVHGATFRAGCVSAHHAGSVSRRAICPGP